MVPPQGGGMEIVMQNALDYRRLERSAKLRNVLLKILIYSFLTIGAIVVLFPFYWMILSSVKSYGAYNAEFIPKFFTLSPTFENYVNAFTAVPLGDYFLNTLIFLSERGSRSNLTSVKNSEKSWLSSVYTL